MLKQPRQPTACQLAQPFWPLPKRGVSLNGRSNIQQRTNGEGKTAVSQYLAPLLANRLTNQTRVFALACIFQPFGDAVDGEENGL